MRGEQRRPNASRTYQCLASMARLDARTQSAIVARTVHLFRRPVPHRAIGRATRDDLRVATRRVGSPLSSGSSMGCASRPVP